MLINRYVNEMRDVSKEPEISGEVFRDEQSPFKEAVYTVRWGPWYPDGRCLSRVYIEDLDDTALGKYPIPESARERLKQIVQKLMKNYHINESSGEFNVLYEAEDPGKRIKISLELKDGTLELKFNCDYLLRNPGQFVQDMALFMLRNRKDKSKARDILKRYNL